MKKAIFFLLTMALAASAIADTTTYSTSMPGGLPGKLSNNVQAVYDAAGDKSGYSVGTYHGQGTKSYASSSGDAAIYVSEATKQTIPSAPVGTASASWNSSDWKAL